MKRAILVARGELTLLLRSRVAALGLGTLLALSAIAAATSYAHMAGERSVRSAQQQATDDLFAAQPARHPHRVVHYGSFAHRPLGVLAAFDPGVDRYTGTTLYLEGHRQNAAAFGAARESSGLIRFGELTPAFVLQVLTPLLLVFMGFPMVARDRENGSLVPLRALGVQPGELLLGKALALAALAALAMLPTVAALAAASLLAPTEAIGAGMIALAYALYLLVWVVLIVAVSGLCHRSRTALVTLVAVWAGMTIVVPRLAADIASRTAPQPSRIENDLALQTDLRRIGDSHDPNDPFFADFRRRTLQQFGVARIEDLPLNYRGLVSLEGEALTSRLFVQYALKTMGIQRRQVTLMDRFAVLSPALAARRVSMAAAGTDLENHWRFLQQAEAFRFDMVQRLNRLHAEAVDFADDSARSRDAASERRSRVGAGNWAAIPDFRFVPDTPAGRLAAAGNSFGMLLAWLCLALALGGLAARRMRAEGP